MNPNTKSHKIRRCVVCSYPFSDRHHLYPKRDGGKETIVLCPNHHRFANIIQLILQKSGLCGMDRAEEFAQKYCDEEFNQKVLRTLIGEYIGKAANMAENGHEEEDNEPITYIGPNKTQMDDVHKFLQKAVRGQYES